MQAMSQNIVVFVSQKRFLARLDLTGLTMLAWALAEILKKQSTLMKDQLRSQPFFQPNFEFLMRGLEQAYLRQIEKGTDSLRNQTLIMTIQSFNKLNQVALRNNMLNCVSS